MSAESAEAPGALLIYPDRGRALGYAAAASSGVLYGISSLLVRGLLDRGFPTLGSAALRSLIASGFLVATVALFAPRALQPGRRDLAWLGLYALVTGAAMPYTMFAALDRAPVGVVIALSYTAPPLAALLARLFLREPLSRLAIVSLAVASIGVVLVSGVLDLGGERVSPVGIGLGLALGVCAALFAVGGRRLLRTFSASTITLYSVCLGGAVLLTADALSSRSVAHLPHVTWVAALLLVGTALVPLVFARYLFTWSMNTIGPAHASLLGSLELAAATLGALAIFGETPTPLEAAGIAVVLAGAVLVRLDVLRLDPVPVADHGGRT